MKYIIAGNYTEYFTWCRRTGLVFNQDTLYVTPQNLVGRHFSIRDLVKIGTWKQREDLPELRWAVINAIWPWVTNDPLFEYVEKAPLFEC